MTQSAFAEKYVLFKLMQLAGYSISADDFFYRNPDTNAQWESLRKWTEDSVSAFSRPWPYKFSIRGQGEEED